MCVCVPPVVRWNDEDEEDARGWRSAHDDDRSTLGGDIARQRIEGSRQPSDFGVLVVCVFGAANSP